MLEELKTTILTTSLNVILICPLLRSRVNWLTAGGSKSPPNMDASSACMPDISVTSLPPKSESDGPVMERKTLSMEVARSDICFNLLRSKSARVMSN